MAMINLDIVEWERILLDTTVIISLNKAQADDVTDPVLLFTKRLIGFLDKQKSGKKKERVFCLSPITVMESISGDDSYANVSNFMSILDGKNVEFLPFDLKASLEVNKHLSHIRKTNKTFNDFALKNGHKSHELVQAREWISKDMMIAMTAKAHNIDVVITQDKKTFYPIAREGGVFCALAYPEYFQESEEKNFVLKYEHEKAEKENALTEAERGR